MEQKTVEQPMWREIDVNLYRSGYNDGYTTAQQSQPMWREIEGNNEYRGVVVCTKMGTISQFEYVNSVFLTKLGYTHYLSLEDLLRLPIAQSK